MLETADLPVVERGELTVALAFASIGAACRAVMDGATGAKAILHSGEEAVRRVIRDALEEFWMNTGEFQIENRFRFLIAE